MESYIQLHSATSTKSITVSFPIPSPRIPGDGWCILWSYKKFHFSQNDIYMKSYYILQESNMHSFTYGFLHLMKCSEDSYMLCE